MRALRQAVGLVVHVMHRLTQVLIEDLEKRLEARKRGETMGYGELKSLGTVLSCSVEPRIKELEELQSMEELDPAELEQFQELKRLYKRSRLVLSKG